MKQRVVTRRARKENKRQEQRKLQSAQSTAAARPAGDGPAAAVSTPATAKAPASPESVGAGVSEAQNCMHMQLPSEPADTAALGERPSGIAAIRPIEIGQGTVPPQQVPSERAGAAAPTPEADVDAGEYDWIEEGAPEGPSALNGGSYSSSFSSIVTGSLGWFLRPSPGQGKLPAPPTVVAPMAELDETEWERSSKSILLAPEQVQEGELDFAEMVYGA